MIPSTRLRLSSTRVKEYTFVFCWSSMDSLGAPRFPVLKGAPPGSRLPVKTEAFFSPAAVALNAGFSPYEADLTPTRSFFLCKRNAPHPPTRNHMASAGGRC
jgi:hypothetical protein